jgi:hypothetical protein
MVVCFVCFYLILYVTHSYCYVCSVLGIVFHCCSVYCLCVNVCCSTTPGVNPFAVNKYTMKHKINSPFISFLNTRFLRNLPSCFKFPKIGNNMATHEQWKLSANAMTLKFTASHPRKSIHLPEAHNKTCCGYNHLPAGLLVKSTV